MKPRWLSRVISTTLTGEIPADLRLTWRTKPKAREALERELFGKRVLFTDKDKGVAPIAVIVADYRSQEAAEGDFRQMKDPTVVSFSPMFHFTDHKIRVHAFYCVLALMVARLMVREADRHGIHISVRELLDTLAGIQETVLLYQGDRGRPRPGECSPRSAPPSAASTTCSDSPPTTPHSHDHRRSPPPAWAPLEAALHQHRPVPFPTTAANGSSAPTPSAGTTTGPSSSATRPAATPAQEPSPPTPGCAGGACSSTRSTMSSTPSPRRLGKPPTTTTTRGRST